MRTVWTVIVATLLALGSSSVADASETDEVELTRQVIETERKAIVNENLDLTDEQEEVFWPLYNEYQEQMASVRDQYVAIVRRYADAYAEGIDDDLASELMKDWLAMETDSTKVRRKYFKKLDKVLPTALVLRFFQIENKLTTVIRAEVALQVPLN